MKYSISHIFAITFWFAITIAAISVIRSADSESTWVITLITSSFSLATLGITISAIFSAIYGPVAQRPFWVGGSIVCCYLLFADPFFDLGLSNLCLLATEATVSNETTLPTNNSLHFGLVWQHNTVAAIFKNAFTPLLGLIGGILAQSISNETAKQKAKTEAEQTPKTPE